jgi:hypothetical protein
MPCGQGYGCYNGCSAAPLIMECENPGPNPYMQTPKTRINPHISGYDKELEFLSDGAARYNSHWRPTFNPNGFTPSGFM